jgi:hypothetical protein
MDGTEEREGEGVSPLCFLLLQNAVLAAAVCFVCWVTQSGLPALILPFGWIVGLVDRKTERGDDE